MYIYLDPRKPGDFNYNGYHFNYEPFYVGKGKGKRMYDHLGEARNLKIHNQKVNKIRKIQKEGSEPIIIMVKNYMNRKESLILEEKLGEEIKLVGDGGTLTNGRYPKAESGGIGELSKESRDKISKNHRDCKDKNNPNYGKGYYKIWVDKHGEDKANEMLIEKKKKDSEASKGRKKPKATKDRISQLALERSLKNSPITRSLYDDITSDLNSGLLKGIEISKKYNIHAGIISNIKTGKWTRIRE